MKGIYVKYVLMVILMLTISTFIIAQEKEAIPDDIQETLLIINDSGNNIQVAALLYGYVRIQNDISDRWVTRDEIFDFYSRILIAEVQGYSPRDIMIEATNRGALKYLADYINYYLAWVDNKY